MAWRVMKFYNKCILARMSLGSRGWSSGLEYLGGRRGGLWVEGFRSRVFRLRSTLGQGWAGFGKVRNWVGVRSGVGKKKH